MIPMACEPRYPVPEELLAFARSRGRVNDGQEAMASLDQHRYARRYPWIPVTEKE